MLITIPALRERESPLEVRSSFGPHDLEETLGPSDFRMAQAVEVDCRVTLAGEHVRIKGHVGTRLESDCSRCLGQFKEEIDRTFDLIYAPDPDVNDGEEIHLEYDDLDVGFYRDDVIDLRNVILEAIVLDLPMQRVCDENCKGLCGYCGVNLNLSECTCEPEPDQRLQVLAKVKKRLEQH